MGGRIRFDIVENGDSRNILGRPVTFFDIASTKAKQFGFTMQLSDGRKFTCVGDEPYNEVNYEYVKAAAGFFMKPSACLAKRINSSHMKSTTAL